MFRCKIVEVQFDKHQLQDPIESTTVTYLGLANVHILLLRVLADAKHFHLPIYLRRFHGRIELTFWS